MRKKLALLLTSAVVLTSFINNQFALYQNVSRGVIIRRNYDLLEEHIEILNQLKDKLEGPKILSINVKPDQSVYIIGDIHADRASFDFVRNIINKDSSALVVLLGNYAGDGNHNDYPVALLSEIAKLKIKRPKNVILLSGNHERGISESCSQSSCEPTTVRPKSDCFTAVFKSLFEPFEPCFKKLFKPAEKQKVKIDEIAEQSSSESDKLIDEYNTKLKENLKCLPLGVVLKLSNSKKVFCTHGGVPIDSPKSTIVLNLETELGEDIIQQLLVYSPADKSTQKSLRYPHTSFYKQDFAYKFLKENEFSCMFRANDSVKDGFRKDFDDVKHYTVFSSANYKQAGRIASIVRINSNHENFNVIKFGEKNYNFLMGGNVPNYEEISTIEGIEI